MKVLKILIFISDPFLAATATRIDLCLLDYQFLCAYNLLKPFVLINSPETSQRKKQKERHKSPETRNSKKANEKRQIIYSLN